MKNLIVFGVASFAIGACASQAKVVSEISSHVEINNDKYRVVVTAPSDRPVSFGTKSFLRPGSSYFAPIGAAVYAKSIEGVPICGNERPQSILEYISDLKAIRGSNGREMRVKIPKGKAWNSQWYDVSELTEPLYRCSNLSEWKGKKISLKVEFEIEHDRGKIVALSPFFLYELE